MNMRSQILENMNYHLDSRVIASTVRPAYAIVGESRDKASIQLSEDFVEGLVDDWGFVIDDDDSRELWLSLGASLVWVSPDKSTFALEPLHKEWLECAILEPVDEGQADVMQSIESGCRHVLREQIFEVQVKYAVCSCCEGHGTVVNPNIDAGGISSDDFEDDPDFEEDYFGGLYDVVCPACKGKRVESQVHWGSEWNRLAARMRKFEDDSIERAQEDAYNRAYGC